MMLASLLPLARTDFGSPMIWALVIGWIMSVVLHELAHGIVGCLGGDYTIRERGGLSLNPLQYVDPVNSLILPAVFLLMGGIPLPGGVNYIRRDLLRSRGWESAMSLAGPAMNILLFFLLVLPFHPAIGWADPRNAPQWENPKLFLAAMAQLQLIAALLNLLPVPPLDGFQALAPWMEKNVRIKLSTPPVSTVLIVLLFVVLWKVPQAWEVIHSVTDWCLARLGFDAESVHGLHYAFAKAMS